MSSEEHEIPSVARVGSNDTDESFVEFPAFESVSSSDPVFGTASPSNKHLVDPPKTPDNLYSNPSSGEKNDTFTDNNHGQQPSSSSLELDLFLPTAAELDGGGGFGDTTKAKAVATTTTKSSAEATPTTPDHSVSSTDAQKKDSSRQRNRISRRRHNTHKNSPRRHHHHHRDPTSSKSHVKDCVCGRGVACIGMTQAFRLLGDPRAYYVELPRYRKDPPGYKYVFRNNLRQAYLRSLVRQNPEKVKMEDFDEDVNNYDNNEKLTSSSLKRRYVALHHFHPAVVRAFYENPLTSAQKHKVPISITEHELKELDMGVYEEDQILSVSGMSTGGYYFVPSYPHEKAHEDLKTLITAVRASRKKNKPSSSRDRKKRGEISTKEVPKDIEIQPTTMEKSINEGGETNTATTTNTTTTVDTDDKDDDDDDDEVVVEQEERPENDILAEEDDNVHVKGISNHDVAKIKQDEKAIDVGEDGLTSSTYDFDQIWEKTPAREIETGILSETIVEEENEDLTDGNDGAVEEGASNEAGTILSGTNSVVSKRSADWDRPWATPKYRRDREKEAPKRASGYTEYIDPTSSGDLDKKLAASPEYTDDGDDIARIAADMTVFQQKPDDRPRNDVISPMSTTPDSASISKETDLDGKSPSIDEYLSKPKRKFDFADEDAFSVDSGDSATSAVIALNHQMPGADPTLRIQVHNDLIAWESKRRSDLAQLLEYNRQRWQAACDIIKDGIAEAQYAERLIYGISKASKLFADSLRAVYDDKLLDDRGNAVKNSFLQNRLAKQRSKFEYSIENVSEDSAASARQSMLLDSIVEAQLEIAKAFVENTDHMEQEILPEIADLKAEIIRDSRGLEVIGNNIIDELKRSEIEVKNIWDVFDAMVTGDLMEYTVHGSTHGGSSHGGSFHSSSMTGGSSSIHGFLTPSGDNEAPIVSSVHSPLVKSTFKQLGGVEDGWLIEMYYKSAVAYQRSVFGIAEMELRNLFKEITTLEERRFRKLHQLMLAFAPRQRRLFNALPEHLKVVLENLVGLRIDEESLQKVLDESVRDRSRDHLKGSTAHKSSILNRSRINAQPDSAETEIEVMETTFGSPFASPMILLSKVVELKPTGLKSLVNAAWKPALAVVTSEGNILVFETSEVAKTPTEAFKSLYPPMNFDNPELWVSGRKAEIVKSLTPAVSLKLTRSTLVIPPMRKNQLEITEEKQQISGTAKSRFMNAVKSTGQPTKCTLRVPALHDATEWASLLERTKKVLLSQSRSGSARFRF